MFRPNALYYTDGYKIGHKAMLAIGTTYLYGTWIPRSLKHAPKIIKRIFSGGQRMGGKWLRDIFNENFFFLSEEKAMIFVRDMSLYLNIPYDGEHFRELHQLGYLPLRMKALPEGIETLPNIPHATFINTVPGFAWLTLYVETIFSSLLWKTSTSATLALQFKRNIDEYIAKTDKTGIVIADYMAHDFSARGLDPFSMIASGLGHAMAGHRGSDSVIVIPAARYYYNEPDDEVCINSVNASEHSVSTTKIFTVGEKQMIIDWLEEFPKGILSIVADTFDLWKLLLEYIADPVVKKLIMGRDGKVVIRPDSGDPVDIICGEIPMATSVSHGDLYPEKSTKASKKGVVEILWDIFGGTINDQGYAILDSHIGAIYGDSINLDRQVQIYERLGQKGFACTNVVLGVGSFTYQFNTRDTLGFAAKGAWFKTEDGKEYDIYKDPITDDGSKRSLRGRCAVHQDKNGEYYVKQHCTEEEEKEGLLEIILENGILKNQTTLTEIRRKAKILVQQ